MGEYAATEGELDATGMRFAIVAARFNRDITEPLLDGRRADPAQARRGRRHGRCGFRARSSRRSSPSGSRQSGTVDAVVCLGAVIRGETAHFEYVAGECAAGVTRAVARHRRARSIVRRADRRRPRAGARPGRRLGRAQGRGGRAHRDRDGVAAAAICRDRRRATTRSARRTRAPAAPTRASPRRSTPRSATRAAS